MAKSAPLAKIFANGGQIISPFRASYWVFPSRSRFSGVPTMKLAFRPALCFSLALLLTSSLLAAEPGAAKAGKKGKKAPPEPAAFKLPPEITLAAEQQTKLDALKTQYSSKLVDAQKKVNEVYTTEQRKAMMAARKDAQAASKKGKELKASVDAAVQLSDEQKKQLAEAQKDFQKLNTEVRDQVVGLLTDEQKQHIKGKGKKKKNQA